MKTAICIIAGTACEESQDFALILEQMYIQYAQKKGLKITQDCERSRWMELSGNVSGIEQEHGVHRLVRVSPFDPQKRRHTTHCKVLVGKQICDDWTDHIRSYVLNPYTTAKNHRNGKETPKVYDVLNGNPDLLWD